jgi:hypothetical protein
MPETVMKAGETTRWFFRPQKFIKSETRVVAGVSGDYRSAEIPH